MNLDCELESEIPRLTAELAEARETINLLGRSFEAAEFKRLRYREALEYIAHGMLVARHCEDVAREALEEPT